MAAPILDPVKYAKNNSRDDPYTLDRCVLQDMDDLAHQLYVKKRACEELEQKVLLVQQQCAQLISVLQCTDAADVPTPHSVPPLEQDQQQGQRRKYSRSSKVSKVSLNIPEHVLTTDSLKLWSTLQDQVDLFKLLGSEFMHISTDVILFNVHCYEKNYQTLPNKMFRINRIPNSNDFKMKPKEISFITIYDEANIRLMSRSSEKDMIICFQKVQSLIFDLVDRENIYQTLISFQLIKDSVVCSRDRTILSFNIPRLSTSQVMLLGSAVSSIESICQSNVSIKLRWCSDETEAPGSSGCGWVGEVFSPLDENPENLPADLKNILLEFFNMMKEPTNVVKCIQLLMDRCAIRSRQDLDTSEDGEPSDTDQFAIF